MAEHQESTRRQYGLRERATALGWTAEQIVVIDADLGRSGASTDREGFQRLVAEVGMGRAGIVLGLEVSRLARNSIDLMRISAPASIRVLAARFMQSPFQRYLHAPPNAR